ncbi:MAG: DUF4276 family protein [Thiotrichaceae bacterium]|nr:DUF4276 family protein [Thiotrichaceae bacterium]
MSYIEIHVIVEGQTEQTFIREVLAPNLASQSIFLQAHLIGKVGHKGGAISFERAKKDIGNYLKQRPDTYISTMFDYFRIDSDWPGLERIMRQVKTGQNLTAEEKAKILENATFEQIQQAYPKFQVKKRFIPYISMHEFEALLFSNAKILADKINSPVQGINNILANHNHQPEEINNTPKNAPSKQIERLTTSYRKVFMGKVISEAIGIPTIRDKCPHFDSWLNKLENLKKR